MQNEYWTNAIFYSTGDAFFADVIAEIRKSVVSIKIEAYIFSVDRLGSLLLSELKSARQRGVQVKICVDGAGSYASLAELQKMCTLWDLELFIFRPLPDSLSIFFKFLKLFRNRLPFVFKKVNRRNHQKLLLFDDQIAFVGSRNITEVHSESLTQLSAWKDFGVKLEGPSLAILERSFQRTCNVCTDSSFIRKLVRTNFDRYYDPQESFVRLNTTRRMRSRLKKDLLLRIRLSNHHIRISTAYFLPRPKILKELILAAQRGVRVQIIIPGLSDVPVVKWAAYRVLRNCLKNGVEVYEYQRSILHSKFLLIDESFATVGSTNFNHRSFLHDLELEVCFVQDQHVQMVLNEFRLEKSFSEKLSLSSLDGWPWYLRFASRIAYRLRYIL